MKKYVLASSALFFLAACANHAPAKDGAMALPGFMNKTQTIERQRPVLPVTHLIRWNEGDRLLHGLELDYISGMSRRDYLFEEPNQELFNPMVRQALDKSGLAARTDPEARYALQIEFTDLDSAAFGRHFAGKTSATYRIVDRRTNGVVYQNTIRSNFVAEYPGLNEDDASFAYDVSAPGVIGAARAFGAFSIYEGGLVEVWNNNSKLQNFFGGDSIAEVSQGDWNNTYQAYAWVTGVSALAGPSLVVLGQLNPANYVSLQLSSRPESEGKADAARFGNLSTVGEGSRNARKRAQQLNTHILAQSLTFFLLDLAESEQVPLTMLVACKDAQQDAAALIEAVRSRSRIVTDDCRQYLTPDKNRGVGITAYK
jgi:hypothetical protein